MPKSLLVLSACLLLSLLAGCGGSKPSAEGEIKTNAPINNNAPEAKSAPVAPTDPSIQYPGQMKGKKGS